MLMIKNISAIVGQILVLLNISIFQTVLLNVLFGNFEWYIHQLILVVLNLVFIFFNLDKLKINRLITSSDVLILPLIIIYLMEYPRFFIFPIGFNIILTTLCLLGLSTFWVLLKMLFQSSKEESDRYCNPAYFYINFNFLVLSVTVLTWVLIYFGIIDYTNYPVPSGFSTYIDNNASELGSRYYAPLYLTIIEESPKNIGLLSLFASFSGISYEPHIAMFFLAPSWLLLYKNQQFSRLFKFIFNVFFIFFLFISFSLTSILSLLIVFFIFSFKNITGFLRMGLFFIFIIIVLSFFNIGEFIGLEYFVDKMFSKGGSSEYSVNFLKYIINPKSIFGYGAFNVPYPYTLYNDIGLLSALLILTFYFILFIVSFNRLFSNKKIINGVGLASLYFIFHAMKIPQLVLTMPFTIYILFLLSHYSSARRI